MNIKQLKKELRLSNKDLAEFFNMSYDSYSNSSAKKRYERAMCSLYNTTKQMKELNYGK
tara:strand:- start:257 stop:433 length:177 start_codon:yes stop_codon:yes gene_type:complete